MYSVGEEEQKNGGAANPGQRHDSERLQRTDLQCRQKGSALLSNLH